MAQAWNRALHNVASGGSHGEMVAAMPRNAPEEKEKRLAYVKALVKEQLSLSVEPQVKPTDEIDNSPIAIDRFTYLVTLNNPKDREQAFKYRSSKPGCVQMPPGTEHFVVQLAFRYITRFTRSAIRRGFSIEYKVGMTLLLDSIIQRQLQIEIVPKIYGWANAWENGSPDAPGWIIRQYIEGQQLFDLNGQEGFNKKFSIDKRRAFFSQLAAIVKALQSDPIPAAMNGFGGLQLDKDGQVGYPPWGQEGWDTGVPWPPYRTHLSNDLYVNFLRAGKDRVINSFLSDYHLRARIGKLQPHHEVGLQAAFEKFPSEDGRCFVHGDLAPENILVHLKTLQITGILPSQWSLVTHPAHEFLKSFGRISGQLAGWRKDQKSEEQQLRYAKLHGFPKKLAPTTDPFVDWENAKLWEEQLEKQDVLRPRTIEGIEAIADLHELTNLILPLELYNKDAVRTLGIEEAGKFKVEHAEKISDLLDHMGYPL